MNPSPLQREIKQTQPFDSLEAEALLNVLRTHDHVDAALTRVFKARGVSASQYNVLRILRGAGREGLPSLEIRERMLARVPDVTRLVDRLEKAGLAERARSAEDRRVVRVYITAAGRKLLAALERPLRRQHQKLLGHLKQRELRDLSRLLAKVRDPA